MTIEKQVLAGQGSVDVALERNGKSIACEISVTTTVEHEIGNIEKCLAAGFDHVILVASDNKTGTGTWKAEGGGIGIAGSEIGALHIFKSMMGPLILSLRNHFSCYLKNIFRWQNALAGNELPDEPLRGLHEALKITRDSLSSWSINLLDYTNIFYLTQVIRCDLMSIPSKDTEANHRNP